ncbi:hypothetical protein FACS1894163_05360 [Spirochaetia bacterium]|nr:hypothetical protein FACS1894163_05360 [Spirochaetia bacterium]
MQMKKGGPCFLLIVVLVLLAGGCRSAGSPVKGEPAPLETSRAGETAPGAKPEEQPREPAVSEQSSAALSAARGELDRISGDAEKAAAIEAQLISYYTLAGTLIRGGNLGGAAGLLGIMRDFLETPAFQNINAVRSRKELYLISINTLEGMIIEARKNEAVIAVLQVDGNAPTEYRQAIAALRSQNARLEEQIADLNRTLVVRDDTIAEQAASIEALKSQLAAIQQVTQ